MKPEWKEFLAEISRSDRRPLLLKIRQEGKK